MKDEGRQPATKSDMTARVWAKARQRSPIPGAGPERHELRWVGGPRAEVPGRGGPCGGECSAGAGCNSSSLCPAREWWVGSKQAGEQGTHTVRVCSGEAEMGRDREVVCLVYSIQGLSLSHYQKPLLSLPPPPYLEPRMSSRRCQTKCEWMWT